MYFDIIIGANVDGIISRVASIIDQMSVLTLLPLWGGRWKPLNFLFPSLISSTQIRLTFF